MPASRLTHRQREVLRLAAMGLGNREIGHRLGCSPRTVQAHIFAACKRLGVTSRIDAWRQLGWLAPPPRMA